MGKSWNQSNGMRGESLDGSMNLNFEPDNVLMTKESVSELTKKNQEQGVEPIDEKTPEEGSTESLQKRENNTKITSVEQARNRSDEEQLDTEAPLHA